MFHFRAARGPLGNVVVIAVVFGTAIATRAQCAPLRVDPVKLTHRSPNDPLLPESGYLSNTTYTNSFFGFALDLPIPVQGHLVKLPLTPAKQHALLAIAFQDGDRTGSLTIDAVDPRAGLEEYRTQPQQQQVYAPSPSPVQPGAQGEPQTQPQIAPQGTLVAPQPQLGPPEFRLPAGRFQASERHKGENYTLLYRTEINDYRVGVLIATNDKIFLQKSKQAMAGMRFYCTTNEGILATKAGDLVTPEGDPYEGPTVPTWRADTAIRSNRGLAIPPGEIAEGVYRNPELGLEYELPRGWAVLPNNNSGNPPADLSSVREFQFLHACSRTLLRIQRASSGDTGGPARRPMITLRVLDPVCLAMRMPSSASDIRTAEEVGVSLETLAEFGQIASHELTSLSGRLFMVFRGTISAPAEGDQLPQRMSQAMFATDNKKMLLVWSFMAPTAKELAGMPPGGIRLEGSQPIDLGSMLAAKK